MRSTLVSSDNYSTFKGELEIEIRDRRGNLLSRRREANLIKIFAKEMLANRLPYSKIWDPTGGTGSGAWVDSNLDILEEFAAKYILFGAAFDESGLPLGTSDTRYYTVDPITGGAVAKTPNIGADNLGSLINPVPISEPDRPLKKIENVYFEQSYQPADGSPLTDASTRAINNILVLETTLRTDEYNGFGSTSSDYFAIAEVALAGGAPLDATIGSCECAPDILFLQGVGAANNEQVIAVANGSESVSIDPTVAAEDVNRIKSGDQLLIVDRIGSAEEYDTLDQVNPYYLVLSKSGRDLVLDRTPVNSSNVALTGNIGIYRTTLRLFSQRILAIPFTKNASTEIVVRWRIYFN